MNSKMTLAMMGVATLGLTATAAQAETVITFDELVHGQRVTASMYEAQGVRIGVENYNKSFDKAVAFDTHTLPSQTSDDDLTRPWDGGNLMHEDLGKVLIIQENNNFRNGIATNPDDEGGRPAGEFRFNFTHGISSFGLDLVDVEGPSEYGNGGGYIVTIFKGEDRQLASFSFGDFVTPGTAVYDSTIMYGNNTANRIQPITAAMLGVDHFDKVIVSMGGSGAIDNVRFTAVPTPSAAAAGLALLATLGLRRRRQA